MPEEDEFEPDERKPGTGRFQKVHKEQSFHSGVQLGEQGFKLKVQGGKEDFFKPVQKVIYLNLQLRSLIKKSTGLENQFLFNLDLN